MKRDRIIFSVKETKKERDIVKSVWFACEIIGWFCTMIGIIFGELTLALYQDYKPLVISMIALILTLAMHETRKDM